MKIKVSIGNSRMDKKWRLSEMELDEFRDRIFPEGLNVADGLVSGGVRIPLRVVSADTHSKASYYDLVLNCKDLISTSAIAKDYGKSAVWMNRWRSPPL